jgi:hypothetical protein
VIAGSDKSGVPPDEEPVEGIAEAEAATDEVPA